ncbi:NusG domain II-containing protein [Alkalibacter saccharofermentans]|uniref:Uncharacterized protein n=1 Tax=Alkalibacter saccharofermentans DSM 14828 TaxID=1120975 RepID=A0A1M4YXF3_9FIRM|nr:NusG domain II-containing protein [Alkalibacter saccharofermentans]SHF10395.1 hypothetical protein SAMN02746064_01896 [Alkalibacter saccharofermentans DSM 14828]
MKKKDLVLMAVVLIIAVIGLLFSHIYSSDAADLKVVITIDGEVFREIPLTKDTNEEIRVEQNGDVNIVIIDSGVVRIVEATCPDQICVHTTPADENGEMIVCLPNRVIVEVTRND